MSTSALDPDAPGAEDASGEAAGGDSQFVTFALAGEMFAVPLAPVQEIIRMPPVAHLPLAPDALEGLANLRGRVLPIINLRRLFGSEVRAHDDTTRALVIQIGQPLAFVVDRVASVISVDRNEIESTDAIQSVVNARFLDGVIKRQRADGTQEMLLVVDFARVMEGQFDGAGTRSAGPASHAQEVAEASADALADDELRLVSFSVSGQEYALDISEVQEIVQLPERITALPNAPAHMLGLVALRNRLLPLVSMRSLFGLAAVDYTEQQRIVVTVLPGGMHVGLVTDAVKEVLSVPRTQTEPMPPILAGDQRLHEITSVCRLEDGKRLVSIIATERLLHVPQIAQALDATQRAMDEAARGAAARAPTEETETMQSGNMQTDSTPNDEHDSDDDIQAVIFRLGAEEFGVPIISVQEIVRVPPTLTRVPKTPHFVEGVINLRGTVLPVIDQRARLGLPALERCDGQRIMVYLVGGMRTGFIVDSVAEVLRIPRADIAPAPVLSGAQSQLITRIANLQRAKRLVMLIDPQRLLDVGEVQAVQEMGSAGGKPQPIEPAPLPLAA